MLFRLIWAHISRLRLIRAPSGLFTLLWTHLGYLHSFEQIWTDLSSCIFAKNLFWIQPSFAGILSQCRGEALLLMYIKAYGAGVASEAHFRLIWAHLDLFRLIQALLSSFGFIWAHFSWCITGKIYFDWTTFGRRIPLWRAGAPFNKF